MHCSKVQEPSDYEMKRVHINTDASVFLKFETMKFQLLEALSPWPLDVQYLHKPGSTCGFSVLFKDVACIHRNHRRCYVSYLDHLCAHHTIKLVYTLFTYATTLCHQGRTETEVVKFPVTCFFPLFSFLLRWSDTEQRKAIRYSNTTTHKSATVRVHRDIALCHATC